MDNVELDETLKVDALSAAESAVRLRLDEHGPDIAALRQSFASLRERPGGHEDLVRLVTEAERVQERIGVPEALLTENLLRKAGVPALELQAARAYVEAALTTDEALECGRQHLARARKGDASVQATVGVLEQLLDAWTRLEGQRPDLVEVLGGSVDAGADDRLERTRSACASLLGEAVAAGGGRAAPELRELLAEDWVEEAIEVLGVSLSSLIPADKGAAQGREQLRSSFADSVAAAAPARAGAKADGSPRAGEVSAFTFSSVSRADAPTVFGLLGSGGASQRPKSPAPELTSVIERPLPSSELGYPPSNPCLGPSPQQQPPQQQPRSPRAAAPPPQPMPAPQAPAPRRTCQGPAELWHAVHVGDANAIIALIQRGLCHGLMRDASDHSVLWHSLSFRHLSLAGLILDRFPPGTEYGVDLGEVHNRRGDTMLHLLCMMQPFTSETAQLFKRIAQAAPPGTLEHVNASGRSFLDLAAASLNFWVLRFVCVHFPVATKALVCSERAPLAGLSQSFQPPPPPPFAPTDRFPEHFGVVRLLGYGAASSGRVPFADVAFDVGPASGGEGEHGRFLAHRVIAGAQSQVLLQQLESLPVQQLPREGISACIFRVDGRISREVFRCVLQFLYTGVVQCGFSSDVCRLTELLLACMLYQLPKPLADYTQCALCPLLPTSPAALVLEVFNLASERTNTVELPALKGMAACVLTRVASIALRELPPDEVVKTLERVYQAIEQGIFQAALPPRTGGGAVQRKGKARWWHP